MGSDYSAHSNRGGGNRLLRASGVPTRRSPRNQRDLGLANRAEVQLTKQITAERIRTGMANPTMLNLRHMVSSMASSMRATSTLGLSVRQLKVVLDILKLDAAPALPDPVPEACKVLPLKPPSRDGAA